MRMVKRGYRTPAIGTPSAWAGYTTCIALGQDSVTMKAAPEGRMQLTGKDVNQETSEWEVKCQRRNIRRRKRNEAPGIIAFTATNGS